MPTTDQLTDQIAELTDQLEAERTKSCDLAERLDAVNMRVATVLRMNLPPKVRAILEGQTS